MSFQDGDMVSSVPARAILVCGVPASGKSSFAKALARRLQWAIADLDTITNPLFEHLGGETLVDAEKATSPGRAGVNAVRYQCLYDTAAEILGLGTSVVAIAPFTSERASTAGWAGACERLGLDPSRVDLAWVDTPAAEIVARMRRRGADRDREKVLRPGDYLTPAVMDAPAAPHLRVDGTLGVEEQVVAFVNTYRPAHPSTAARADLSA